MNTTSLFAEVLVVGAGSCVGVLVWAWAILGGALPEAGIEFAPVLLVAIPFAYLLGLLTDRVADMLHRPLENLQGRSVYGVRTNHELHDLYFPDHRLVRQESGPLSKILDYTRSRVRICRGWLLNCAMLGGGVGYAYALGRFPNGELGLLTLGFLIGLGVLCLFVLYVDSRQFISKVKRQAAWLRSRAT